MTKEPVRADQLRIVSANEASWADLAAIFGGSYPGRCKCQRFKVAGWIWHDTSDRDAALREQTGCDDPDATSTSGLVAYVDGEPAGWVAVQPRTAFPKLAQMRLYWKGRKEEDRQDPGVWAITCFCVRNGYRGRGLTYALADAAVEHAREHGATAVEGYGMLTQAGKTVTWGELFVGAVQVFAEAGMREVTHPSLRRMVLRIDFEQPSR
jgi:GNAT superfamily N-acetyltransferase